MLLSLADIVDDHGLPRVFGDGDGPVREPNPHWDPRTRNFDLIAVRATLRRYTKGFLGLVSYISEQESKLLYSWIADASARITMVANAADEAEELENGDGFVPADDPAQAGEEEEQGHARPRIRVAHRRTAARTVYFRCVAKLGLKAYSPAQRLVVENLAVRELAEMRVRHSDVPRLLLDVVCMYFTPTREQYSAGAMFGSAHFGSERAAVDIKA